MRKNNVALRAGGRKFRLFLAAGLMMLSAAALLWFTLQSERVTTTVMVAAVDLPAGAQIESGQLKSVQMNLGVSQGEYLAPNDLPDGAYVLVPVGEGQLIAKSNVAGTAIDARVPVVFTPSMALPKGLGPGDSVDVWVVEKNVDRTFGAPYALILAAEVSNVTEPTGVMANGVAQVELSVPADAVSPVLAAIANESALSIILRPTLADG
ncbi:MAG: hypothetical protein RIQ31_454 [Actinomycetota bacterium]|jgi:hypothetical protein